MTKNELLRITELATARTVQEDKEKAQKIAKLIVHRMVQRADQCERGVVYKLGSDEKIVRNRVVELLKALDPEFNVELTCFNPGEYTITVTW